MGVTLLVDSSVNAQGINTNDEFVRAEIVELRKQGLIPNKRKYQNSDSIEFQLMRYPLVREQIRERKITLDQLINATPERLFGEVNDLIIFFRTKYFKYSGSPLSDLTVRDFVEQGILTLQEALALPYTHHYVFQYKPVQALLDSCQTRAEKRLAVYRIYKLSSERFVTNLDLGSVEELISEGKLTIEEAVAVPLERVFWLNNRLIQILIQVGRLTERDVLFDMTREQFCTLNPPSPSYPTDHDINVVVGAVKEGAFLRTGGVKKQEAFELKIQDNYVKQSTAVVMQEMKQQSKRATFAPLELQSEKPKAIESSTGFMSVLRRFVGLFSTSKSKNKEAVPVVRQQHAVHDRKFYERFSARR